jgi:hypothetical protein
MSAALEAKERESAALQERAAMFATATQKVENLRALRLAREASADEMRRESGRTSSTRAA